MQAIIFDTETTGLESNEVIELAYLPVSQTETKLNVLTSEGKLFRFKPKTKMQFGAMAVHHILPEDLEDELPSSEACIPDVTYMIGHNIDYDWKVMGKPQVKRIDTLAFCRKLWPECDSHTQSAMLYFLEGATDSTRDRLKNAHNALADVIICKEILFHIIEKINVSSLEELWQESEKARIPDIMPFGKFKGEPISSVDRGWANWYSHQEDTDPYLIKALKLANKL